jgi:glycosyltransferase involved in cell wall biosynthesis
MQGLDLREYDVVISSSFNFAHHVLTGPQTRHICYCHSPARFLWDYSAYAEREGFGRGKRFVVESLLPVMRSLDLSAASGVDAWISTSGIVRDRIRKFYRRRSQVIPPPVDMSAFQPAASHDNYYLLLMRLVGWKRADIVIEACNQLGLKLVVAGDGRELSNLKAIAGPTISFAGRVEGVEKANLFARCAAFILPALEDFGITPLEAMASGRPVIALGAGGALDTVKPGVTGEFFYSQTVESLVSVLRSFDPTRYDPETIEAEARKYDSAHFRRRILDVVQRRGPPSA